MCVCAISETPKQYKYIYFFTCVFVCRCESCRWWRLLSLAVLFWVEDEGGHRKYGHVTGSAMVLSQTLPWLLNICFGVCPLQVSFSRPTCNKACVGGFVRSPGNAEGTGGKSARKEEKELWRFSSLALVTSRVLWPADHTHAGTHH